MLGYANEAGIDRISSQMIAKSVGTHPVVIRALLKSLRSAGLVRAREGRGGGVSLARSASKISLSDVFRAVEAENLLAPNRRPEFKGCPVSRSMKKIMSGVVADGEDAVTGSLKGKTLEDIVHRLTMSENS
jgi:Rrf2 family protein